MNLFDELVQEALKNHPELAIAKFTVEKELLHYDILYIMNQHHLLHHLTFIGGRALRSCYGGVRLSEDLDFTGGKDFSRESLSTMGTAIKESLREKYGLELTVSEPFKEAQNLSTWKIKIETRPSKKHLPLQKIHLVIRSVPSYERQPRMFLNPYGVDRKTQGLIIQTQSREEIYADKLLAFAFRANRIQFRDLWDMVWLHQQGIKPRYTLLLPKLEDRHLTIDSFLQLFQERLKDLSQGKKVKQHFEKEMQRFLPLSVIREISFQGEYWDFMIYLMNDLLHQAHQELKRV